MFEQGGGGGRGGHWLIYFWVYAAILLAPLLSIFWPIIHHMLVTFGQDPFYKTRIKWEPFLKYESSIAKYRFDLRLSLVSGPPFSFFRVIEPTLNTVRSRDSSFILLVAEIYKKCLKMQTLH